jgi:hypothetical protein
VNRHGYAEEDERIMAAVAIGDRPRRVREDDKRHQPE